MFYYKYSSKLKKGENMQILSRVSNTGIDKGVQTASAKVGYSMSKLAKAEVCDSYTSSSNKTNGKTSKFNIVKHNLIKFKTPKDIQQKVNDIFKDEGAKKSEYKSPKELAQAILHADKSIKETPYFKSKLEMVKCKMSDEQKQEFVKEVLNEEEKISKEYKEKLEIRKQEATKTLACNQLIFKFNSNITKMKQEKDINKRMELFQQAGNAALKAQKLNPSIKLNPQSVIYLFYEILQQTRGEVPTAFGSFLKYESLIKDEATSHFTQKQKTTLDKITNCITEKREQELEAINNRLNNL